MSAYSVLNLCKNGIDIKLLHESQMEDLCKHIWSCCFRDCNVAWLVQQFDPDWNISTTIGWIDVKCNIHVPQEINPSDFCDPVFSCNATMRLTFVFRSEKSTGWIAMKLGTNMRVLW